MDVFRVRIIMHVDYAHLITNACDSHVSIMQIVACAYGVSRVRASSEGVMPVPITPVHILKIESLNQIDYINRPHS